MSIQGQGHFKTLAILDETNKYRGQCGQSMYTKAYKTRLKEAKWFVRKSSSNFVVRMIPDFNSCSPCFP